MTEKQKNVVAFGAGLAVGVGVYALFTHWKASRAGNMVSSRPIPKELRVRPCEGGVFFGNAPPGKCPKAEKQCPAYCGKTADADGNILVLGGPGSGKTTGVIYPTLGTWPGSIVALDCKGGMEKVWKALHPNSDKKLFVFAPYREHGGPCTYDPFAIMRQDPEHVMEYAWDLAESLIPIMLSEREPVWKANAENTLAGAFLYYYDAGKSFVEAIRAINSLSVLEIEDMISNSDNQRAQAFVKKLRGASGKTMASIGAEMHELVRLVMNREIMDALTPVSDRPLLDWEQLNTKRQPFDVCLDIPGNKLKLYAPLIRLMITQLVKTLSLRREKTYSKADLPGVLLMLDEFPQLGNVSAVVDALATLRSKGVTILLCTQSLAYFEAIYGKAVTRIILETCQCKVVFNVADTSSQAYLSALIGGVDTISCSVSLPKGVALGKQRRPLIHPEELAYLRNPIVLSPYGVCEVEKQSLYVKPSEPVLQNEYMKDLDDRSNRHEGPPEQTDSQHKEADDSHMPEEAVKEVIKDKICAYCEKPRRAKAIMSYISVAKSANFRKIYLKPLLEQGRLRRTHPDNPRHPDQKYYTCAHLSITSAVHKKESDT